MLASARRNSEELAVLDTKEEAQISILQNLKMTKLTVDEQLFASQFNTLEERERDKAIKFFQCVGDLPHTAEFTHSVRLKRVMNLETAKMKMFHEDCSRFSIEVNRDQVVVDKKTVSAIAAKPRWDAFTNSHFAIRRRIVGIFLRATNKVIIRLRAGKRLE